MTYYVESTSGNPKQPLQASSECIDHHGRKTGYQSRDHQQNGLLKHLSRQHINVDVHPNSAYFPTLHIISRTFHQCFTSDERQFPPTLSRGFPLFGMCPSPSYVLLHLFRQRNLFRITEQIFPTD